MREKTVAKLKDGKIDILVATDVAARGLDVKRITHVVNFDVPYDTESYVHRIGRTGRAGRSGEAILFIAPRERNLLRLIERATRQTIEPLSLPTVDDVNTRRLAKFKARIGEALASGARGVLSQGRAGSRARDRRGSAERRRRGRVAGRRRRTGQSKRAHAFLYAAGIRAETAATRRASRSASTSPPPICRPLPMTVTHSRTTASRSPGDSSVGRQHGAVPGNIVGAIANEARLAGPQINGVDVRENYSLVRLPANLPQAVIGRLSKVRVRGQALNLEANTAPPSRGKPKSYDKPKSYEKPGSYGKSKPYKSHRKGAKQRD